MWKKNNNNHAVLQQYQATVSMKTKNSQQHAQNLPINYIFQSFVWVNTDSHHLRNRNSSVWILQAKRK